MSGVPADREAFAAAVDHTVLGPTTTREDCVAAVDAAAAHGTNVCIPPWFVASAAERAPDTTVVTVVDFPHGQGDTPARCDAAERAESAGADEVDVVANVGRLRGGEHAAVETDLEAVVASVAVPVKVIVEAPLLTESELHAACRAARDAGADFVKTATGFADGGATAADVSLMADYLPVKASGGVGSYEAAVAMFEAGATRIGASAGVDIVEAYPGE